VDVNPLAVEMAKLSLWLITLAKNRPFSFLDHALRCGDSLLGVHNLDQIRNFHPVPDRAAALHATLLDPRHYVEEAERHALALRRQLEAFPVLDVRDAELKANLSREAERATDTVRLLGDLIIGAALSTADEGSGGADSVLLGLSDQVLVLLANSDGRMDGLLRQQARRMLDSGTPVDGSSRRPFHWPVEFPEVFLRDQPGFDAVVGNPPFLGGVALAARLGELYGRFLKSAVPESHGFVDLAVYFHRRAVTLASATGVAGLLGPQTLTTTANRRAGTDAILSQGRRIFWAKSRIPWPGTASIVVCAICYGPDGSRGTAMLNDKPSSRVNSALEATVDVSSVEPLPPWLMYSEGTHLYGAAFLKSEPDWKSFIEAEPSLIRFLRPYVNADSLCSSPTFRSNLIAVDFDEHEKAELVGLEKTVAHLEDRVSRERSNQTRQIHEHRPWLFWDKRTRAYKSARALKHVLVCPSLSKHLPMVFVDPTYLFSKGVKLLITDDFAVFGLLQSSVFSAWVVSTSPMREERISFSTRNSLDTFVPPKPVGDLRSAGRLAWEGRLRMMNVRKCGITTVLNLIHDPESIAKDLSELRDLHRDLDRAVAQAYGWRDLELDHGFHETVQGIRYTIGLAARVEVLDRLLRLNQDECAKMAPRHR
jgi:hypothetical protein